MFGAGDDLYGPESSPAPMSSLPAAVPPLQGLMRSLQACLILQQCLGGQAALAGRRFSQLRAHAACASGCLKESGRHNGTSCMLSQPFVATDKLGLAAWPSCEAEKGGVHDSVRCRVSLADLGPRILPSTTSWRPELWQLVCRQCGLHGGPGSGQRLGVRLPEHAHAHLPSAPAPGVIDMSLTNRHL